MSLEQDITRVVEASEQLTATVDNKIEEINSTLGSVVSSTNSRVQSKLSEMDSLLNSYRNKQSHFRVTKNQALEANTDGSFPAHWSSGHYIVNARLVETVSNGVEPHLRTDLAREFLRAISSDYKYFAEDFNIWELEFLPNRGGENINVDAYLMYQYLRRPTQMTIAAVVKHIRGIVPEGFWCHGLKAGEEAKVCGIGLGAGGRNHYTHCHPYSRGRGLPPEQTGVIQVALPAAVTGDIPLDGKAWGQFAYLGDAAENAYDSINF
jgi:hypothetical protein